MAETGAQWLERTENFPLQEGLSRHPDGYLVNLNGERVCGANRRGTLGQGPKGGFLKCEKPLALGDNGKCHLHGKNNLKGPAHPNYQDGNFSNYLPSNIQEKFERNLADPNLLSMRSNIALLKARQEELMGELSDRDGGELYKNLQSTAKQLHKAHNAGDGKSLTSLLEKLDSVVNEGVTHSEKWGEIARIGEQIRRHSVTEVDYIIKQQEALEVGEATVLADQIMEAVFTVMDPEAFVHLLRSDFTNLPGPMQKTVRELLEKVARQTKNDFVEALDQLLNEPDKRSPQTNPGNKNTVIAGQFT